MAEHIRGEALVVTDSEGNHYVLTRDVLEQAKATKTQRTQLARLFDGEEVSGYAFALGTAPGSPLSARSSSFAPSSLGESSPGAGPPSDFPGHKQPPRGDADAASTRPVGLPPTVAPASVAKRARHRVVGQALNALSISPPWMASVVQSRTGPSA